MTTSIIPEPKVSGLDALALEWRRANPSTPDEIASFYRTSAAMQADLADFHENPNRQRWTQAIVALAKREGVQVALDIGCGQGDDMFALWDAQIGCFGVEPNEVLRQVIQERGGHAFTSLDDICPGPPHDIAPAPTLVLLMDVLEHIPNPAAFLDQVIQHVPVNGWIVEHTPTWDIRNPTHLRENWGWSPGHQLTKHGFQLREQESGFRIWQRIGEKAASSQTLILVSYRAVAPETVGKISQLHHLGTWNVLPQTNDALVSRARSMAVSRWWRDDPADVLLMVDSDIVFDPADAMKIVQRCREGYPVIAGAYAIRDGTSIASRITPGESVTFAPDAEPVPIEYAATGFLAVRRDVIDALITRLPLCHADQTWAFWPFFDTSIAELPNGNREYLSEDWHFCRLVREAGFQVYLDPSVRLGHIGQYLYELEDIAAPKQKRRAERFTIQEKARE